jgi:hypothetical protein
LHEQGFEPGCSFRRRVECCDEASTQAAESDMSSVAKNDQAVLRAR